MRIDAYDLPIVGMDPGSTPQARGFDAPKVENLSGPQMSEQGVAMTKAGLTMQNAALEYQDHVDTAFVKEMDNKLADAIRVTLYDPEKGYLRTPGKRAVDSRADTLKGVQDVAKEIESGLQTDVQKAMFRKVATQRMQSAFLHIDNHAMTQAKVYEGAESKARLDSFKSDAVQAALEGNADKYQISRKGVDAEIDAIADLTGMAKDADKKGAYQQTKLAVYTQIHSDVVTALIADGKYAAAKNYYADHSHEIQVEKRDEIQKQMNAAEAEAVGVTAANTVWNKVMGGTKDVNAPVKATELWDALQSDSALLANKPGYQAAKEALHLKISAWNAQQSEMNQAGEDNAYAMLSGGKTLAQIKASPSWAQMGGERQSRFIQSYENILSARESRAAAHEARMDRVLLRKNAVSYFQDSNPANLVNMSENEIIAKKDMYGFDGVQHLLTTRRALLKPGSADHLEVITTNERMQRAAKAAKILPYKGTANEDQQVAYAQFETEIQRRLKVFEMGKGKKANGDELQKVIDETLLDKVKIDRIGPDPEMPAYQLTTEQMSKAYVVIDGKPEKLGAVPANQRVAITAALVRHGRPVTEREIMNKWIQAGRPR